MDESSSESFTARRTESVDAPDIAALVRRSTEAVFGRVNVEYVIEKANLAISLCSPSTGAVLAHMSLLDYPSLPSLPPSSWEEGLAKSYRLPKATPMTALFLHLFVAKEGFQVAACAEILRASFMAVPLLQYILLTVEPETKLDPALEVVFSAVPVCEGATPPWLLFVAPRHCHFPSLHVRAAAVEDADNLTAVFQQHSSAISQQYGPHFLAEMIASQDTGHRTVVAEVGGRSVGFISVTTDVDVALLEEGFSLEAFHGLRASCEGDGSVSTSQESSGVGSEVSLVLSAGEQAAQSTSTVTIETASSQGSQSHVAKSADVSSHTLSQPTSPCPAVGEDSQAASKRSSASVGSEKEGGEKELGAASEQEEPLPPPPAPPERPRVRRRVLHGQCCALAVQLFAMDDRYEMRSVDLLPAVFRLFPDHDFLVLTQPSSVPEFPLLTHFTRVAPKVGSVLPQELYVLHKASLLHSFTVHRAGSSDLAAIQTLVGGVEGGEGVMRDVVRAVEGGRDSLAEGATRLFAAVARCAGQLVGVAVIRQEVDIGRLRSHFAVEDFVYLAYHRPTDHAHLHHLTLNPAFTPHTRFFIKELLRISGTSCLYYHLPSSHESGEKPHTITAALREMVPVKPRQQVTFDLQAVGVNAPLSEVLEQRVPRPLYHTNRKLTLEPKVTVGSSVVVVGASDTAMALLETLVFCPHLCFNNITLVSPHGFPPDHSESLLPHHCCYWPGDLQKLGLESWVNVVKGRMSSISRADQFIEVEGAGQTSRLHYDYLVLCMGTQYQLPADLSAPPRHVFSPSCHRSLSGVLQWVEGKLLPSEGSVVVYGSSVAAISVVRALLELGLAGSRVVLVQPRPEHTFNNPAVEERAGGVEGGGRGGGEGGGGGGIAEVCLVGREGSVFVKCQALVVMESKGVDSKAFKAMTDACLVFDSRLVIDRGCSTNDPVIFAAGPLTKFSRQYYADQWTHSNFSSKEVGQQLASTLLQHLDPTLADATPTSDDPNLILSYSQPKSITALLPGPLHYLHVEKPGLGEPLESLMEHPSYGRELVTDTESGYFRLHVNQYGRVQTITVLSAKPFEATNYLCLYGLHERSLNDLLCRYGDATIKDFFSYFREPWAYALFHDRYPDFLEEVRELLSTCGTTESDGVSLEERVKRALEEDPMHSLENHRDKLAQEFAGSQLEGAVRKRLFHFLHYNSNHLSMYARPDLL